MCKKKESQHNVCGVWLSKYRKKKTEKNGRLPETVYVKVYSTIVGAKKPVPDSKRYLAFCVFE